VLGVIDGNDDDSDDAGVTLIGSSGDPGDESTTGISSAPAAPSEPVVTIEVTCEPDPDVVAGPGEVARCVVGQDGVERTWVVPAEAPVTWADIASFHALTGHITSEPAHVILTGLDTNFISSAKQHVVDGELLDAPARVRFTPVAWGWDYGDGEARTSTTPGAAWENLGLDEFAPTSTSHAYEENGEYTIRTSVTLRAEYSLGAGWIPIAGTLTIPTDTFTMRAYTASTVLVDADCSEDPHGPGC
jgi:hypothetical protein